jgi:hypothetical protein
MIIVVDTALTVGRISCGIAWAHSDPSGSLARECLGPIRNCRKHFPQSSVGPFEIVRRICHRILWAHSDASGEFARNVLGPFETVGRISCRIVWAHSDPSGSLARECLGPIRNCWKDFPQNSVGPFETVTRIYHRILRAHSKLSEKSSGKSFKQFRMGQICSLANNASDGFEWARDIYHEILWAPFRPIGSICQGTAWAHLTLSERLAMKSCGPMQNDQRGFFMGLFEMIDRIF